MGFSWGPEGSGLLDSFQAKLMPGAWRCAYRKGGVSKFILAVFRNCKRGFEPLSLYCNKLNTPFYIRVMTTSVDAQ